MQDRPACPLFRGRQVGREAPAKPEPNGRTKGPLKSIVPRQERIDRHASKATLRAGLCPSPWTDRKERPRGRRIGEKAAPARRANGKQAHAVTPPPIKKEESDTADPPITRRTSEPAGQVRRPRCIFRNHRPSRRVTKRVYVSSYVGARRRADMGIRASLRKRVQDLLN